MDITKILSCPVCKGSVQKKKNFIICKSCKAKFPIKNNIPRLLTESKIARSDVKDSFNFQWDSTYQDFEDSHIDPQFKKKIIKVFLDDNVRLDVSWFKNKLCLDAGCGIGRWTYSLSKLGGKVVSFDITNSGVELSRRTNKSKNVEVIQADIFYPPFKKESFDFIISWGVLHHTLNTKRAFEKLVPLLKKGGIIFIMVYEKHNPIKLFNTNLLRKIFSHFSNKNLYKICGYMAFFGRHRFIRYAIKPFIQIGSSQHGLFDCYSTPINHHHTEKEVIGWFKENGLKDITITNTEIYKNPLKKFLRGEHRGTILIRGEK